MAKLLDLKKINSFAKVAETSSFARAAELLNYSPAALTVQIQQLEKELDVVLLDRTGKRVSLTSEGVQFYEYAKKMLSLNEEALDSFRQENGELHGRLRIGTIASLSTYFFPQLIRKFHVNHPNVEISIVTDTPSALYQKLSYYELDLIIVLDEPLSQPDLVPVFNMPVSVVCCASKNHPLSQAKDISLETILDCPCILTEKGASYRRILERALVSCGKCIQPHIESDSTGLIIELLHSGLEYSVLPLFLLTDEILSGELVILPVPEMVLSIQMQSFYMKGKYLSREMQTFITMAKRQISKTYIEAEQVKESHTK